MAWARRGELRRRVATSTVAWFAIVASACERGDTPRPKDAGLAEPNAAAVSPASKDAAPIAEPGRTGGCEPARFVEAGNLGLSVETGTGRGDPRVWARAGDARTAGPRVRYGDLTVTAPDGMVAGRTEREQIQRTLRRFEPGFRYCYAKLSEADAAAPVPVEFAVNFTIERSGAVSRAAVEHTDLRDPCVVQCLVESVASLVFERDEARSEDVRATLLFGRGP